MQWAVQMRSRNRLDGYRQHLVFDPVGIVKLFRSRADARAYAKDQYGYIWTRTDLRHEPHGWMLPRAVRVKVSIIRKA